MPISLDQPKPPNEWADRIQNGRYNIHLDGPDEKPTRFSRVSKITGTLGDDYHLNAWRNRMTVVGLTRRDDLWKLAQGIDEGNSTELDKLCADAQEAAGASRGRNLGSALHGWIERYNRGEIGVADFPEVWKPHGDAYAQAITDHKLKPSPEHVERTVLITGHNVKLCGTLDLGVVNEDGALLLADLKTNSGRIYSMLPYAVQLAAYHSHTNTWDWDSQTVGPRIPFADDYAVLIHLPSEPKNDKPVCELHEIDLSNAYDLFLQSLDVWESRNAAKRKGWLSRPMNSDRGDVTTSDPQAPTVRPPAAPLSEPSSTPTAEAPGPVGGGQPDPPPTIDQVAGAFGAEIVTTPRLSALRQRIDDLVKAGHKAALKTVWIQQNVPPFDQLETDADLRAADTVIQQVEADHEMPFGVPDQTPPIGRESYDQWVDSLPGDLAAEVEAGLPPFEDCTVEQLDELRSRLESAGVQATVRRTSVEFALAVVDEQAADTIRQQFDRTVDRLHGSEAERAVALAEAVQAGALSSTLQVVDTTPLGDTKSEVLAAGRQVAEQHGLTKPRSSDDVYQRPTLVALGLRNRQAS